jgi:hypothetical protein
MLVKRITSLVKRITSSSGTYYVVEQAGEKTAASSWFTRRRVRSRRS